MPTIGEAQRAFLTPEAAGIRLSDFNIMGSTVRTVIDEGLVFNQPGPEYIHIVSQGSYHPENHDVLFLSGMGEPDPVASKDVPIICEYLNKTGLDLNMFYGIFGGAKYENTGTHLNHNHDASITKDMKAGTTVFELAPVRDLVSFLKSYREKYPGKKLDIIGHSQGAGFWLVPLIESIHELFLRTNFGFPKDPKALEYFSIVGETVNSFHFISPAVSLELGNPKLKPFGEVVSRHYPFPGKPASKDGLLSDFAVMVEGAATRKIPADTGLDILGQVVDEHAARVWYLDQMGKRASGLTDNQRGKLNDEVFVKHMEQLTKEGKFPSVSIYIDKNDPAINAGKTVDYLSPFRKIFYILVKEFTKFKPHLAHYTSEEIWQEIKSVIAFNQSRLRKK